MSNLHFVLLQAAASPFGLLIRSRTDARALFQAFYQTRKKGMDPLLENLQMKAAGRAFVGEADFVIYKKQVERRAADAWFL